MCKERIRGEHGTFRKLQAIGAQAGGGCCGAGREWLESRQRQDRCALVKDLDFALKVMMDL